MIERLDSHDKHTFNEVYGQIPYESKQSVPCFVIKTAETVNSVRSNGLTAYWYRSYDGAEDETDTAYSGFIPGGIVKLYYPNGVPDVLVPSEVTNGWSLALKGSFKPEYSGGYAFSFGGDGEVSSFSIETDGATVNDTDLKFKIYDSDYNHSNIGPPALTADKWYDISIKYKYNGEVDNPAGLVCMYINDDVSEMPDRLVLSAGVTAPLGASTIDNYMPIALHTVNAVSNVKLNTRKDGADLFTFKVPFVSSASTYKWAGFYRRSPYEYFSSSDSIRLKKFDMIEAHEGYWTTADSRVAQTVQKFSGQIRDFNISYSSDGNDYLEVICASYEIFLKDSFCLDQPNYMDYITSGYMTEVAGHVNGETRPRAYDGWELRKAYENLLLNAYIDPTLTHQKEKRNDYNNEEVTGNWFIDQISQTDTIYLANEKDYGRPMVLEDDNDPDAEYNYAISTGEYVYDAINEILESYGFDWGINRYGYAYLQGIDSPTKTIHSTTYVDAEDAFIQGSGWGGTVEKDFDCVKACYLSFSESYKSVGTNEFNAQRIDAIVRVSPRGGEEGLYYSLSSAGGTVKTGTLDNSYDTSWSYYAGVDPSTGLNPCIINLATNLSYDTYTAGIAAWSGGTEWDMDSLLLYDRDINTPVFYFKTSDEAAPGHVVALDIKDTTNDMRNDCLVLGRRTGTKTGIDHEGNISKINPNNPVLTFHQSRTVDVNSIHSASAVNYSGRPLQTIIVDEKIANQSQADYVSFSFVEDHRIASKEITFKTLGNPLLEINDCIAISEEFKEGLKSNKKMWITDIQTEFADKYITSFKASDRKPYSSFRVKTEPDLELFDNNPFWDVRTYNGGTVGRPTGTILAGDTTIVTNTVLAYCPPKGYIMIKTGYEDDTDTETILYESISSPGGVWQFDDCVRGLQGTDAQAWGTDNVIVAAYDPYMMDSMNITPKITFNLVKSGYLQLQINTYFNRKFYQLTTLTDHGNKVGGWPIYGREYVEWGKNVYFTWNGNDDIGRWNDFAALHNDDLGSGDIWISGDQEHKIEGGFFTIEPKETRYTQVYPHFNLSIGDNTTPFAYPHLKVDTPEYFYIRRGICSTAIFQIDYSSVYWSPSYSFGGHSDDDQTDRSLLIDNREANNRYATSGSGPVYYQFPVYICTDPSAVAGGNHVKFTIKDRTAVSQDDYFNRKYKLHIVAHVFRYNFGREYSGGGGNYSSGGHLIQLDDNEHIIIDDKGFGRILYHEDFLPNGLSGTFNPKDYPDKFDFYNSNFNHLIKARGKSDLYTWWNVIYFSGYIMDKSGRSCPQHVMDRWSGNARDHRTLEGGLVQANESGILQALGYNSFPETDWQAFLRVRGNIIGWFDHQLSGGYYPALDNGDAKGVSNSRIDLSFGPFDRSPMFMTLEYGNRVTFVHGDSEEL